MAYTTVQQYLDDPKTNPAERKLIAATQAGKLCILNSGIRPGTPNNETHIRASLLRLLILGGSPACELHETGISLVGAYITGTLNLRYAKGKGQCTIRNSHFEEKPNLRQAELPQLDLCDSYLPGLFAQGLKLTGSLFLRNVISTDTVDLNAAQIGWQFTCEDAKLDGSVIGGERKHSLNAEGITTGQSVFLRNLTAKGSVGFGGSQIGGELTCEGATLEGPVINSERGLSLDAQSITTGGGIFFNNLATKGSIDLNGAQIGGQLVCRGAMLDSGSGSALTAQRLNVARGLFWENIKSVKGKVSFSPTHVGDLVDDGASWALIDGQLDIDGLTYDRLANGPLTFAYRKDWLAAGSRFNDTFSPQPYTQFAKVLREMGHASEARKALMERDRLLFAESHKNNLAALNAARTSNQGDMGIAWLRYHLLRFWAWFSFTASGYGHAPQRALFWSLGCIAFGAVWFFLAWQAGVMVPNSAIILTSPDWFAAMAANPSHPCDAWTSLPPGQHYETFYALPYALDVFVPFLSIGQESAWAATTTGWWGWATRMFTFAYQITGWAITALGIASITGFVQKSQPD